MSLLIFESFGCYHGNMVTPATGWYFTSFAGPASGIGRRGTYGLSVYAGTGYYAQLDLKAEHSGLVIGFAVKPSNAGTINDRFLSLHNAAGSSQFVVDCTAAGRVRIKASPTGDVLAESADAAITFNIYQYFELKCAIDDSNGTVQVRVNGADIIAFTGGLNLQQAGSGGAQKIQWRDFGTASPASIYDDLYICNLSGGTFTDFLGDIKVDAFWPTADGTYQQFTTNRATHYDAINDIGNDAATYYIESDTPGEKDSFTITPAGDLPTIHAISIRNTARNPDTGVAEGTLFIRQGGVDRDQASFERGDTVEQDDQMLLKRPDTGGPWTKAALEAMEFGFEFSGAS